MTDISDNVYILYESKKYYFLTIYFRLLLRKYFILTNRKHGHQAQPNTSKENVKCFWKETFSKKWNVDTTWIQVMKNSLNAKRGERLIFFLWNFFSPERTRRVNWPDIGVWYWAYFVFSEEIWNIYILQHKQTGQCKQNKDFAKKNWTLLLQKLFCCKHKREHEHGNWNNMSHELCTFRLKTCKFRTWLLLQVFLHQSQIQNCIQKVRWR